MLSNTRILETVQRHPHPPPSSHVNPWPNSGVEGRGKDGRLNRRAERSGNLMEYRMPLNKRHRLDVSIRYNFGIRRGRRADLSPRSVKTSVTPYNWPSYIVDPSPDKRNHRSRGRPPHFPHDFRLPFDAFTSRQ